MKSTKKALALTLVIIMALTLLPVTAAAASGSKVSELIIGLPGCSYELSDAPKDGSAHINVVGFTGGSDATSGDGWSYDADTATLTLDGYNGSGIYARMDYKNDEVEQVLTVKLVGENTVNNEVGVYGSQYFAITVERGSVEFQGPGTLTINSGYGVEATQSDNMDITTESGSTVQAPVAGRIRITNGAVINSTTKWTGFIAPEMIVDSGCSVNANTTGAEREYPINVRHLRCNGTVITTHANQQYRGIMTSMYCTAGPNVMAYSGTSKDAAVAVTLTGAAGIVNVVEGFSASANPALPVQRSKTLPWAAASAVIVTVSPSL